MKKLKIAFFILIIIFTSSAQSPINAASDHQNGQIRVRWSTSEMYLNQNNYIEQEFTPLATTSFKDGESFRWSNQYHFDFCWQGSISLSNVGNRCGYVGFGLGSMNGNNYFGNFDFAIFNAVEFETLKNYGQNICNNSGDAGYVQDTKTYYMNCWRSVVIQMNTTYVLRVQYDQTSSANENWWSATLRNKSTNETITIGKVKAYGNNIQEPLASLETVIFYQGDAKPCDSVPVMDLKVSPIKGPKKVSNYANFFNLQCVKADVFENSTEAGFYNIRLGGAEPALREPSKSGKSSPSPTSISNINSKPIAPVLKSVNILNNTININVNLGSIDSDLVYLIAPKLTDGIVQKIIGEKSGSMVKWSLKFNPNQIKGSVPLSFFAVRKNVVSDEAKFEYLVPNSNRNSFAYKPVAPNSVISKVSGSNLIVTAKVITSGNSAVTSVQLTSSTLNIFKPKPALGNLLNNSVIFTLPISSSDLSKKIDLHLTAINPLGSSKTVDSFFAVAVPKSPSNSTGNQNISTVVCAKGNAVRTFAGNACPPGWVGK